VLFALGLGDNTKQLYTIASNGTDLQIVSDIFTTRGRSDWSPAGDKISGYTGGAWQREIYLMNTDGTELQQVISNGSPLAPSFSPDSGWIAFTGYLDHFREVDGCEIYILRLSDHTIRRLTNNDYCDYQPRWGP
jgi:Tol biopolymer transport system component